MEEFGSGNHVEFETPENVKIEYAHAGLGTRFLAWLVDTIILWVLSIVVFVGAIVLGILTADFTEFFDEMMQDAATDPENFGPPMIMMYLLGIAMLVSGLSSFVYFSASELLMRGQTVGKRMMDLRVAKRDGFALDAMGVLIRNLFRVVDNLPVLWIVPVLSPRGQRLGDIIGGTIVIADRKAELSAVRTALSGHSPDNTLFRFEAPLLAKLPVSDVKTVERLLERWESLEADTWDTLSERVIQSLVVRLKMEPPASSDRKQFLEEFLAAEYRRQDRAIG